MARRKTLPESVRAKLALAERLAALRSELYGDRGGPEMARRLGIPVRTWYNYEGGVTVPAEVILKIIELTAGRGGLALAWRRTEVSHIGSPSGGERGGARRRHRWRPASNGPSAPRERRLELAQLATKRMSGHDQLEGTDPSRFARSIHNRPVTHPLAARHEPMTTPIRGFLSHAASGSPLSETIVVSRSRRLDGTDPRRRSFGRLRQERGRLTSISTAKWSSPGSKANPWFAGSRIAAASPCSAPKTPTPCPSRSSSIWKTPSSDPASVVSSGFNSPH